MRVLSATLLVSLILAAVGSLGTSAQSPIDTNQQMLFFGAVVSADFGEYDEARTFLDSLLTINPSHAKAHALYGYIDSACRDLSLACELGKQVSCDIYQSACN